MIHTSSCGIGPESGGADKGHPLLHRVSSSLHRQISFHGTASQTSQSAPELTPRCTSSIQGGPNNAPPNAAQPGIQRTPTITLAANPAPAAPPAHGNSVNSIKQEGSDDLLSGCPGPFLNWRQTTRVKLAASVPSELLRGINPNDAGTGASRPGCASSGFERPYIPPLNLDARLLASLASLHHSDRPSRPRWSTSPMPARPVTSRTPPATPRGGTAAHTSRSCAASSSRCGTPRTAGCRSLRQTYGAWFVNPKDWQMVFGQSAEAKKWLRSKLEPRAEEWYRAEQELEDRRTQIQEKLTHTYAASLYHDYIHTKGIREPAWLGRVKTQPSFWQHRQRHHAAAHEEEGSSNQRNDAEHGQPHLELESESSHGTTTSSIITPSPPTVVTAPSQRFKRCFRSTTFSSARFLRSCSTASEDRFVLETRKSNAKDGSQDMGSGDYKIDTLLE